MLGGSLSDSLCELLADDSLRDDSLLCEDSLADDLLWEELLESKAMLGLL
jgi:hypothetical protein